MNQIEWLTVGMAIVVRCRREGAEAAACGEPALSCPYDDELQRSGWLDGWSRLHAFMQERGKDAP